MISVLLSAERFIHIPSVKLLLALSFVLIISLIRGEEFDSEEAVAEYCESGEYEEDGTCKSMGAAGARYLHRAEMAWRSSGESHEELITRLKGI